MLTHVNLNKHNVHIVKRYITIIISWIEGELSFIRIEKTFSILNEKEVVIFLVLSWIHHTNDILSMLIIIEHSIIKFIMKHSSSNFKLFGKFSSISMTKPIKLGYPAVCAARHSQTLPFCHWWSSSLNHLFSFIVHWHSYVLQYTESQKH